MIGDALSVSCNGGDLTVSLDHYSVLRYTTMLFDANADEVTAYIQIMAAMMGLSALEYDQQDKKSIIAGQYGLGIDESKNAVVGLNLCVI